MTFRCFVEIIENIYIRKLIIPAAESGGTSEGKLSERERHSSAKSINPDSEMQRGNEETNEAWK